MDIGSSNRNRLVEIARQAYGSGWREGKKGGAGRIGIMTGCDGKAHVVKFNTHLSERLFGMPKSDSMITSCNRLRAELIKIAQDARLEKEELTAIREKLGLDNGTDKPTSLLDRTVVAEVVTMIDRNGDVWQAAMRNVVKSSEDMSFETVALRQAFGTQEATIDKAIELGSLGLSYDSLKQAVDDLAQAKGLSSMGKRAVFAKLAEHLFTTLCGKEGSLVARRREVQDILKSIATGNHSVIQNYFRDFKLERIGLTEKDFAHFCDKAKVPVNLRDQVRTMFTKRFDKNKDAVRIIRDIQDAGFDKFEPYIKNAFKLVRAAIRKKDGPDLDWDKEINRFGGIFETNREIGKTLMQKFHGWFKNLVDTMKGQLPEGALKMEMEDGFRCLMFRDLARRNSISDNPEEMFETAALTDFARKGLLGLDHAPVVLLTLTNKDREVLYAALKALPGTVTKLDRARGVFARIVHHLDKVSELGKPEDLTADALFKTIFPEVSENEIPQDPKIKDFEDTYAEIEADVLNVRYPISYDKLYNAQNEENYTMASNLLESGYSLGEIQNVVEKGDPVQVEKYPIDIAMPLDEFGEDLNPGKGFLAENIFRPLSINGPKDPVPAIYTFNFPNGIKIVSVRNTNATQEENDDLAGQVSDKIASLCGSQNIAQINLVEFQLSVNGLPGDIGKQLQKAGFTKTNEHIALTFSLSKTDHGDVRIDYSAPAGCPKQISANVIVHADGQVEKSQILVY